MKEFNNNCSQIIEKYYILHLYDIHVIVLGITISYVLIKSYGFTLMYNYNYVYSSLNLFFKR